MNVLGMISSLFLLAAAVLLPGSGSTELRAVFDMGGIKGDVMFEHVSTSNTSIMVNLSGLMASYAWQIHTFPAVYRGSVDYTCQAMHIGGIFDPLNKTSSTTTDCKKSNACAVGDLTGKHGYLKTTTENMFDNNLPLSGPNSIFGRSLVLFDNNSKPVACALIDASDDVITAVATFRGKTSGVTGTVTLRQSRSNPSLGTTVDVNLFYSNDVTSGSKNLILTISDNNLPDEGIPSYDGKTCLTGSARRREISKTVRIPLAGNGSSTERFLLNVRNISLFGAQSAIGKTLIVFEKDSPKICASIYEVLPIEAEGVFDVDGVKGMIHFKQNSEFSPTVVTADVRGLKSRADKYHVHVYEVLDSAMLTHKNTRTMCGAKHTAGHWNPYGTKSAKPGNGTVDQYEIGDLSGKYGTIGDHDKLSVNAYKDYNLPLFGLKSILYRSLVIHFKNGSRWVCTNIEPKNATFHFKAQANFVGPDFLGVISVEQASFIKNYAHSHITTFFLKLQYKSGEQSDNHKWHIHTDRVTDDQLWGMNKRCKSPLGHYNPYSVSKSDYSSTCGPKNLLRCELGDLSSKLGKYSIGKGKNRFTESENYFAGLNSILGRSIVVHAKNSGSARLGCASLRTSSERFVKIKLTFMKNSKNDENGFRTSLSQALRIKEWRVANVQISELKNCQQANFILIEDSTSNLKSDYDELNKNWPQNLQTYAPVTEAECTAATVLLPGSGSTELRAVFDMGGIKGDVMFKHLSTSNTSIMVNLSGLMASYAWQIHTFPAVYRGNVDHTCQAMHIGGIFDPLTKTSSTTTDCKKSNACAVGDLTGKHGYLKTTTENMFDNNLPLSGPNSIFGRSLVLFDDNSKPVACALIDASDDVITAVATFRGKTSGVTGTVTLRQSRSNPSLGTTVDVNLFYSNDVTSGSKNLILTISDNNLPDEGIPSYDGKTCLTGSARRREISKTVRIPLAGNGSSTERFLLNVRNISLFGAQSAIGKTLIVFEKDSPKICASIYEVLPIEAEGVFDVDGVKGMIHFKQNSEFSPTVVTADVRGLKSRADKYHVHVYEVLDSAMLTHKNTRTMCGAKHTAGHWNPYGTKSAKPGNGTVDQYEIGDLSGKYGTIGDHDKLSVNAYKDYNLPLFGLKSILYRSLVIHFKNGSRWVCTNIEPKNATFHFKAQANFVGPDFLGVISVEQASFIKNYAHSHITTFFLKLQYKSGEQSDNHKWHIHTDRVTDDQLWGMNKRCKSPLGHYNPYSVSKSDYSSTCGPKNLLRCELGDLSSKLGKYSIGKGKNRFTESENYFAGLNSILGRSIVVHAKNSGSARLGCASLRTSSERFVKIKLTFMKNSKNDENGLRTSLSQALKTKEWRVANVQISVLKNCQQANFILIENSTSNLESDYDKLNKNWPQNLQTYAPVTEAACSAAIVNQATYLVLILVFTLLYFST